MTVFTQFIKAERQDEKKPSLSKGNAEEEEVINPEMSRGGWWQSGHGFR